MRHILALMIVLTLAVATFGQGGVKGSQLERQNAAIKQERDRQEQSIKVALTPAAGSSLKPKQQFKVGEPVNL